MSTAITQNDDYARRGSLESPVHSEYSSNHNAITTKKLRRCFSTSYLPAMRHDTMKECDGWKDVTIRYEGRINKVPLLELPDLCLDSEFDREIWNPLRWECDCGRLCVCRSVVKWVYNWAYNKLGRFVRPRCLVSALRSMMHLAHCGECLHEIDSVGPTVILEGLFPMTCKHVWRAQMADNYDYLSKEYERLSDRNRRNNTKKKIPRGDSVTRRLDELHRELTRLRNRGRKNGRVPSDFTAQMWLPGIEHKLNDEQFSKMAAIGDTVTRLADRLDALPVDKDGMKRLAADFAAGSVKGAFDGAYDSTIGMLVDTIRSALSKFAPDKSEIVVIIVGVSLLSYLWLQDHNWTTLVPVAGLLGTALYVIGHTNFVELFMRFASMFKPKDDGAPRAQMLMTESVVDAIGSVLLVYLFPKQDLNVKTFSTYLQNFGRIQSNMETVVNLVVRIVQYLLDLAAQYIGFAGFQLLSSTVPEIDKWLTEARGFIEAYGRGKKPKNRDTYDEVLKLENHAFDLLRTYATNRGAAGVMGLVRVATNPLQRIRAQLECDGVGQVKSRQPPLVIMLRGMSQIGKSKMLRPLVLALLASLLPDDTFEQVQKDYDSHVYSRYPEHQYWDGYFGQAVCIFDEFNITNKKLLTAENAQTELIRAANSFPYVLHMAGLEQKGNVYFRSKVIICTSNTETVAEGAREAVSYPEAVVNRFHYEMEVRLNESYVDENVRITRPAKYWILDKTKLPKDKKFIWDVHELVQWHRKPKEKGAEQYHYVEGKHYDLLEFIGECRNKYMDLAVEGLAIESDDASAIQVGKAIRSGVKPTFKSQMAYDGYVWDHDVPQAWKYYELQAKELECTAEFQSCHQKPMCMLEGKCYCKELCDLYRAHGGIPGQSGAMADYWAVRPSESRGVNLFLKPQVYHISECDGVVQNCWETQVCKDMQVCYCGLLYDGYKQAACKASGNEDEPTMRVLEFAGRLPAGVQYRAQMEGGNSSTQREMDQAMVCMNILYDYVDVGFIYNTLRSMPVIHENLDPVVLLLKEYNIGAEEAARFDLVGLRYFAERIDYPIIYSKMGRDTLKEISSSLRPLIEKNIDEDKTILLELKALGRKLSDHMISLVEMFSNWITSQWSQLCSIKWSSFSGLLYDPGAMSALVIGASVVIALVVHLMSGASKRIDTGSLIPAAAQLYDANLDDIASKVWNKNYYEILGDGKHIAWGFFLYDNVFVLCYHYIIAWKARQYSEMYCTLKSSKGEMQDVRIGEFFAAQRISEDVGAIRLKSFRMHPDIRGLILPDVSIEKRTNMDGVFYRRSQDSIVREFGAMRTVRNFCYNGPGFTAFSIPVAIEYSFETHDGDCGLPVFIRDPTTRSQKFIGMHVAGRPGMGVATCFPGSMCAAAATSQSADVEYPVTFDVIGHLDRFPVQSGKSAIEPSPLMEAWGPARKDIAPLRKVTRQDGSVVGIKETMRDRYRRPILSYDPGLVDACTAASFRFIRNSCGEPKRPMTAISWDEAIKGIPGDPFMDGINVSTSMGYPECMDQMPDYPGKTRIAGKSNPPIWDGPKMESFLKQLLDEETKMLAGQRLDVKYADFPKDETLPKTKLWRGPRSISPSPANYQVHCNRQFKRFGQYMMLGRIKCDSCVGVNPFGVEWDLMARKISRFGVDQIFAGDFKWYDASQSSQILKCIGDHITREFKDHENDIVRTILWMEVYDSYHIFFGDITHWHQGLPSGHPMTTLINCLFNMVIFRMAWVKAHGNDLSSLPLFDEHVACLFYGDDNVIAVSREKSEVFNQRTLIDLFADLGLVYTAEDKSENPPPFRNITQIEFLKRGFRYEPYYGRYCAPLRLETILEMPYWSKKDGYNEICRSNVDNAIRELALHPREVFEEWAPRIVAASEEKLNYRPLVLGREQLLDIIAKMDMPYL